jgi:hypothetical protein
MKKMSKFRESLVDRMIRIYGFENPIVIDFCAICENWKDDEYHNKSLAVLVKSHEEMPVMD